MCIYTNMRSKQPKKTAFFCKQAYCGENKVRYDLELKMMRAKTPHFRRSNGCKKYFAKSFDTGSEAGKLFHLTAQVRLVQTLKTLNTLFT